jgi:cell wall assembly regulator SMI1
MSHWLAEIRRLISSSSNAKVAVGASEAEIQAAEIALSIRFPSQFRAYLSEFGYLGIAHYELNGVGAGVPEHVNLVTETLSEREMFRPYIPVHLLPLENNGAGDHYCIDLATGLDDPPVVFWSHDEDESQTPEPEAESFSSWLLKRVSENVA